MADGIDGQGTARFGAAIALRGDQLVVGAPGIADVVTTVVGGSPSSTVASADVGAVFLFNGVTAGAQGGNDTSAIVQRRVIVTDASTAAVGLNASTPNADGHQEAGARSAGGALVPGGAGHRFGASVALDGDRLVIGAPGANGGRGQVHLFTGLASPGVLMHPNARIADSMNGEFYGRNGYFDANGVWTEPEFSYFWYGQKYTDLTWAGSVLNGSGQATGTGVTFAPSSTAAFGSSLALRGSVMAVGAPGSGGSDNGAVYLFDNVSSNFSTVNAAREVSQAATLPGMPSLPAGSGFGTSVALAVDTSPGGPGRDPRHRRAGAEPRAPGGVAARHGLVQPHVPARLHRPHAASQCRLRHRPCTG